MSELSKVLFVFTWFLVAVGAFAEVAVKSGNVTNAIGAAVMWPAAAGIALLREVGREADSNV